MEEVTGMFNMWKGRAEGTENKYGIDKISGDWK